MTRIATVADYMTRDLIRLSPDMEINRAMKLLLDNRISGAPVVDAAGQLVGVLSKKDCLKAAIDASYYRDWGAMVATHMTKDVQTLDAGTDILAAANSFLSSPFRRFPVLLDGQLVGQISRADALKAMLDNWG
ncbi:MAG: CBS domain-containing protein [Rhodobacteraceae bacterium]|nr:CBS domain-containing protein [Paracoccaceae bacterium]